MQGRTAHKFCKICRAADIASLRCLHECGAPAVNNLHPVSSKRILLDDTLAPVPHSGHVAMTEIKCGWEPFTRQRSLIEGQMYIKLPFGLERIRALRCRKRAVPMEQEMRPCSVIQAPETSATDPIRMTAKRTIEHPARIRNKPRSRVLSGRVNYRGAGQYARGKASFPL
jgi:hypothetical protein